LFAVQPFAPTTTRTTTTSVSGFACLSHPSFLFS
jgi:hypothetical protein